MGGVLWCGSCAGNTMVLTALDFTIVKTIVDVDALGDEPIEVLLALDREKEVLDAVFEALIEVIDLGEVVEAEELVKLARA